MAFSPQLMRLSLDELRKKDRGYFRAKPYTDFLPAQLENRQPANEESFYGTLDPINQRGQNASAMQNVLSQNLANKQALERAQHSAGGMRQYLHQLQNQQPERTHNKPGTIDLSNIDINLGHRATKQVGGHYGSKGKLKLGEIHVGPSGSWAGGTISSQGHTVHVNKRYAPLFQGFLDALTARGYKIHSLGGQVTKNIAGTSTTSLHTYGLAIDINPHQNPVGYHPEPMKENMPPGIIRLAARYGLAWGGNWNGSKFDPMHFSIPYRGGK